jgi:hypothetical protein
MDALRSIYSPFFINVEMGILKFVQLLSVELASILYKYPILINCRSTSSFSPKQAGLAPKTLRLRPFAFR